MSASTSTGSTTPTLRGRSAASEGTRRRSAQRPGGPRLFTLLWRDPFAAVGAVVLTIVILTAILGPWLVGDLATAQDLSKSPLPPFSFHAGWEYALGSDILGRSLLARVIVATRTTLGVTVPAVLVSLVIGSLWGLWAGYHRGWRETLSMRIADVIMSFPSLLLAVVILYVFDPSIANIVLILAITRIPIYLRTSRAEASELQSRVFVDVARTFGTKSGSIIRHHVIPIVLPTLLTLATLEICYVMLAESSLSFLGIGIQPPEVSWGLMVAQGRDFLQSAWWLSIVPGIAIVVTAISANMLAAWLRIATDPAQRWRLANKRRNPLTLRARRVGAAVAAEETGQSTEQKEGR